MKKTTVMAFLLALLAPIMSAWALDTHSTHYGKIAVEVATGEGTVYVAEANNATTGQTYGTWDCKGSSSGDSKTWYIYAKANSDDWEFKGWSTSKTGTPDGDTTSPKKVAASTGTATNSSKPNTTTFYAHFASTLRDPFNITFVPGNYTVDGVAASSINADNYKNLRKVKTVALEATDGKFLNWLINNKVVNGAIYSLPCESDTTVEAVFLRDDQVTTAETYEALVAALANDQYLKITIPSGKEIVVAKGATLTVPAGKLLVVEGTLYVEGTLTVSGSAVANGKGVISKCTKEITQTGNNGQPFNPYGSVKYWKTTSVNGAGSVSSSVADVKSHIKIVNGLGKNIRECLESNEKVVVCDVDTSIAVNHIKSISKFYSTVAEAYSKVAKGSSYPDKSTQADPPGQTPGYAFTPSTQLILLTETGSLSVGSSTNLGSSFTVDCCEFDMTVSGKQINNRAVVLLINGKIATVPKVTNGRATFINCHEPKCSDVINNADSNDVPYGYTSSVHLYDCGKMVSHKFEKTTNKFVYKGTGVCILSGGPYTYTEDNNTTSTSFKKDILANYNLVGGTYTKEPDKACIPYELQGTHKFYPEGSYWKLDEIHDTAVAQIGEKPYESLEAAVAAAAEAGSGVSTIRLLQNVAVASRITIPKDCNVRIELASSTVTSSAQEGLFLVNGTLEISTETENISGCGLAAEHGWLIENNGTVTIAFGEYDGNIRLNALSQFTVHHGKFTGEISTDDGVSPLDVANIRGGVFGGTWIAGYLTGDFKPYPVGNPINYWVGEFPYAIITTEMSVSGMNCGLKFLSTEGYPNDDYSLYSGSSGRSNYSDAQWYRRAELKSALEPWTGNRLDCQIVFDRKVAGGNVSITAPIAGTRTLDTISEANVPYSMIVANMTATPWSYGKFIETYTSSLNVSIAKTAKYEEVNDGAVFSVLTQLYSSWNGNTSAPAVVPSSWEANIAVCRYMLGGKKAAVDRDSVRTAYDSLADAVNAENLQDGDWILVGADSTEKITIAKAGTFTIDPYGFNYDTANVSIGEAYFAKSTTEDYSRAAAQKVESAKAVIYEVAQKVAGVGGQFYDKLTEAVKAAGENDVIKLYATPTEEITLTAEGQSITLNKNGVEFDDKQIKTDVKNASVVKVVNGDNTVYTVVVGIVEDGNGNKYVSVSDAVDNISGDEISVTVTAEMSETEKVTLPQGKALIVTGSTGVTPKVDVVASTGAFVVETEVEGGRRYESKKITVEMAQPQTATVEVTKIDNGTESEVTEEAAISAAVGKMTGNQDVPRTDNTDKLDVLDKITVTPTKIVLAEDGSTVRSATFEVTPEFNAGQSLAEGQKLKFRLPVDANATQQPAAIVYHDEAQFGVYPVQTWEGAKFIEVESSSFSPYGYELLDGETANPVAAIGTTGYASLAAAVAAAQSGETITMLADDDVSLTNGETLTIDKSLIITGPVDEDGKPLYTISGTAGQTGNNNIFITGNGTVTLSNLNIAGFGNDCSTDASHAPVYVASTFTGTVNLDNLSISDFNRGGVFLYGGTFNVTGCTIDCANDRTGAFTKGIEIRNNASGTIADSTIVNMMSESDESVAGGIEFYGNGDVTVSGCTIEGDSFGAIGVGTAGFTDTTTTGTITVEDCEITVWYAALYASALGEGLGTNGTTMRVTSGEYSADNYVVSADYGTVEISGGNFIGLLDVSGDGNGSIAISGGTFDDEIPEEYCADGYIPAVYDEELGLYTVRTGSYVAQNMTTDTKYESFGAALADAQDGDTVQLLANITGVTETYNIDKTLTIDGQGQYKIAAGENSSPRNVISAWSGPRVMFDLTRSTANVTFNNITMDNGEGHYYSYFVRAKSGTATFEDVVLLRGAEKDSSGTAGAGYGAAILADGGNIVVKGDFYADTHGAPLVENQQGDKTAGIFPFTAILHQDGGIYFEDGVNANIGQDLLLVGKQNEDMLDASDEAVKAKIQAMLDAMNVPSGYVPYTLNLADSAQLSFIGASPLGWNNIIDYGKGIMDVAADAYGMTELDKTTTPVEVGLLDDTVLTETFTYEDSNFTVNGNGNTLSGTIEYTDNAGTLENVVMGTEEAPLVLDMTGLSEGKSIDLGTGIAASNVTIKVTEEQATTLGQNIVTWNTEGESEEAAASLEKGITVEIVDDEGEPVMDPVSGDPMEASIIWDAELGVAYIGPCEARLTGPTHANPIYTSLASAIALAADSGDTVTLMTNIVNFTGTQQISKSSLVLDGAGHTIAAAPVATHRNVVNAFLGGTSLLEIESGAVTVKNITLDGDASHAYTYLISANNDSASLTTENITLLHGGELCGDDNGDLLEAGAGYGAAIHLNNGAHLTVKDGFYADTHGAPAEEGQTVAKADGVFPFTGILPEGGSSVLFDLTEDTNAEPTVEIGKDLLLVGMVGAIDSDTAQGILDYMQVPSRFRPYTLTLGDGSAYAFTGASLLGWNEIIDYGKEIMDVSTAVGYEGLDKDETPVEVGLLTDTVLPETFTYEDSNFTVNGNGNALSGTIKYTDDAGVIENIVLGTEEKPLVLDLREVTDPVEIGNLIGVTNVTVLMTAEQATLGQPVFTWNVETAGEPDNAESVKITVLESAEVPYDPEEEAVEKGLVWDDELGIAYIGPCEARLTGPEREPGYMDLTNAFNMAVGGDTVTLFWSGVTLNEEIAFPAGTLVFATNKYELALGENAAFVFTNATSVFRSELEFSTDIMTLEGEVASGYLLRTAADGTTNVYSVASRGQYIVTGMTEDGMDGTAVIKVSDEWIAANMNKVIAEIKTINEIEEYLDSRDATTGMRKWENYVLRQTTNPFRVSGLAANGVLSTTLSDTPEATATTGFTVQYALNEVKANGEVKTPGAKSDGHNFSVNVASVESAALYKVRAYLNSGDSTLVVDSTNTLGVLKVQPTIARSITAVPWKSLETGGDITVADFIRAADLSSNDKLHVYNGDHYDTWTYSGDSWSAVKTFIAGKEGTDEAVSGSADATTLARGTGVWLERASGTAANLHLVGEYSPEAVETPITAGSTSAMSWNLVGAPSYEQIDLNTAIGEPVNAADRIVVPMPGGLQRNYTYKNGKWGYSDARKLANGRVQTFHNTENSVVPAGTGFWYLNTGDAGTIKW